MNMREKIARAIARAVDEEMYWDSPAFLRAADNALNALMEPTEEMVFAGHGPLEASVGLINGEFYFDAEGPHHTFQAMIRAAKEGK